MWEKLAELQPLKEILQLHIDLAILAFSDRHLVANLKCSGVGVEQGQEFQRYKGVSFCVTFSFVWIQKYRKKILSFFFGLIQNIEEYLFQNIQRNNSRTISTKRSLNIISRIQKAKVVIFKTIQLHSVEALI